MTSGQLGDYQNAEPFRPYQLHMVSGRTFAIRHPEMVMVRRGSLVLFTFISDDPNVLDRWETISLMLIESISYLEPPLPQTP